MTEQLSATHLIHSLRLEVGMPELEESHYLQNRISTVCQNRLTRELEGLFDRYAIPGQHLRFRTLDVNAGNLRPDHLEDDLVTATLEAIEEILKDLQAGIPHPDAEVVSSEVSDLELLMSYLESGALAWPVAPGTTPDGLVERMAAQQPGPLRDLVRRLGQAASVRKRIAWHLADSTVRTVVRTLEPTHHPFVLQYADDLQTLHQREKLVEASSEEFAHLKWEFILLYLLLEAGTDFNTLQLVKSTLRQMAARYNVEYVQMLDLFEAAITEQQQNLAQQVNLPKLLASLREEAYKELGRTRPRKSLVRKVTQNASSSLHDPDIWEEEWKERLAELLHSRWLVADVQAQEAFILRAIELHPEEAIRILAAALRQPDVLRQVVAKYNESWLAELVARLAVGHKPELVLVLHQWREALRRPSAGALAGREARLEALALLLRESLPGNTQWQKDQWLSEGAASELIAPLLPEAAAETEAAEPMPDDLLQREDWAALLEALFRGLPLPRGIEAGRLANAFVLRTLRPTPTLVSVVSTLVQHEADRQAAGDRLPLVVVQATLRLLAGARYTALHRQAERWVEGLASLLPGKKRSTLRKVIWQQLFRFFSTDLHHSTDQGLPKPYLDQVSEALLVHFAALEPSQTDSLRALLSATGFGATPEATDSAQEGEEPSSETMVLRKLFTYDKLPVALSRKAELADSLLLMPEETLRHLRHTLRAGGADRAGAAWLLEKEGGVGARALVLIYHHGEARVYLETIERWVRKLLDAGSPLAAQELEERLWTHLWSLTAQGALLVGDWKLTFVQSLADWGEPWTQLARQTLAPAPSLLSELEEDLRRVTTYWEETSSTPLSFAERQALTQSFARLAQRHPHRIGHLLRQLGSSAKARTKLLQVLQPNDLAEAMQALGMEGHPETKALLAMAGQAWALRPLAPVGEEEFRRTLLQFVFEHFSRHPDEPFQSEALLRTVIWKLSAWAKLSEEGIAAWLLRAPASSPSQLHELLRALSPPVHREVAPSPPPPSVESIHEDFAEAAHRRQFAQYASEEDLRQLLQHWKPWHAEMLQQLLQLAFALLEGQPSLASHAASHRRTFVEQLLAHLVQYPTPQPRLLMQQWLLHLGSLGVPMTTLVSQVEGGKWEMVLGGMMEREIQEQEEDGQEQEEEQEEGKDYIGRKSVRRDAMRNLLLRFLQTGVLPEGGALQLPMLRELLALDLERDASFWIGWLRSTTADLPTLGRFVSLLSPTSFRHLLRRMGGSFADQLLDVQEVWEAVLRQADPSASQSSRSLREAGWALLLALVDASSLTSRQGVLALRQWTVQLATSTRRDERNVAATILEAAQALEPVLRHRSTFVALQQALEPMALHRVPEPPPAPAKVEPVAPPDPPKPVFSDEPRDPDEPLESFWLDNAGLVLAAPFIPTFLQRCGVLVEGQFPDVQAQQRAAYLLRRITHPTGVIHEPDLALCKLLAGLRVNDPLEVAFEITEHESTVCAQLIRGMIANWKILGDVKDDTLREGFLVRPGVLHRKEDHWQVTVEVKSYDILMEQLPWGIAMITYSWLKEIVHVEWWKSVGG